MNDHLDIEPLDECDRGNPLAAILDDPEPVNHYREAAVDLYDFMVRCFVELAEAKGNKEFTLDCLLLALGFTHMIKPCRDPHSKKSIPVVDQATLAKKWGGGGLGMTKANVSKMVKKFQALIIIPPSYGQRSLDGCKNMTAVAKLGLKKI